MDDAAEQGVMEELFEKPKGSTAAGRRALRFPRRQFTERGRLPMPAS